MDGCRWTEGVGRTKSERWTTTDIQWKLDETGTDLGGNDNEH